MYIYMCVCIYSIILNNSPFGQKNNGKLFEGENIQ